MRKCNYIWGNVITFNRSGFIARWCHWVESYFDFDKAEFVLLESILSARRASKNGLECLQFVTWIQKPYRLYFACPYFWVERNSFYDGINSYSPYFQCIMNSETWWRHQMETFSALLALCAGNSPVPGEFPAQRPVTRSFDVFFDLCLHKRLSKQTWGWWFETSS